MNAPELSQLQFYRVLDSLPPQWRPCFVTLALTGLRLDELCELQPESLDHEERAIQVNGSKTPSSMRTIHVAEEFWPWVMAAVPVEVSPSYLRDHWKAAVDRAGLDGVRLPDLVRLRTKLLNDAREQSPIQLLREGGTEEARLLAQALPVLALTEDQGRRLLVQQVRG